MGVGERDSTWGVSLGVLGTRFTLFSDVHIVSKGEKVCFPQGEYLRGLHSGKEPKDLDGIPFREKEERGRLDTWAAL